MVNQGCGRSYRPVFLHSVGITILGALLFLVPLVLMIVMSVRRQELATIDKSIASKMTERATMSLVEQHLPYDVGYLNGLNESMYAFVVYPIGLGALLLGLYFVATRSRCYWVYIYYIVALATYILLANGVCLLLKELLKRPRPRQTIEFHTAASPVSHPVPFQPIFTPYTGPNPDGLQLYSTPSGHTLFTSTCLLPMSIISAFLGQDLAGQLKGKELLLWKTCFYCFSALSIILSLLFIPSMAIARLAANAHFLSDTVLGALLSLMFLTIIIFTVPEPLTTNGMLDLNEYKPQDGNHLNI
ncbi:PAP2 superfamily protein [Giardia muris]|uniref:PAP2 superfamily protein n=1 Tax=Giardia muris TaxID=5742 RepID=A0A4Z1T3H1_GIAMU|nr:PAP2 superfamily protein [Giardia muris]|eukprot:TNJ26951.1 PAP2 superfamily protein [Giardia muris]